MKAELLEQCQYLHDLKFRPDLSVGDLVVRNFADLGYEEFRVLPGPSLMSLHTGKITPLVDEERRHFVLIPEVDWVVDQIIRTGLNIASLSFEDQRHWYLVLKDEGGGFQEVVGAKTLHEALLIALITAIKRVK